MGEKTQNIIEVCVDTGDGVFETLNIKDIPIYTAPETVSRPMTQQPTLNITFSTYLFFRKYNRILSLAKYAKKYRVRRKNNKRLWKLIGGVKKHGND